MGLFDMHIVQCSCIFQCLGIQFSLKGCKFYPPFLNDNHYGISINKPALLYLHVFFNIWNQILCSFFTVVIEVESQYHKYMQLLSWRKYSMKDWMITESYKTNKQLFCIQVYSSVRFSNQGNQYWSWIGLSSLIYTCTLLLENVVRKWNLWFSSTEERICRINVKLMSSEYFQILEHYSSGSYEQEDGDTAFYLYQLKISLLQSFVFVI